MIKLIFSYFHARFNYFSWKDDMKQRKCFIKLSFKNQPNIEYVLLLRAKNGKYKFPKFYGRFKFRRRPPQLHGIDVDGKLKTGYLNDKQEGFFVYENVDRIESFGNKLKSFQMDLVTPEDFYKLVQAGALGEKQLSGFHK